MFFFLTLAFSLVNILPSLPPPAIRKVTPCFHIDNYILGGEFALYDCVCKPVVYLNGPRAFDVESWFFFFKLVTVLLDFAASLVKLGFMYPALLSSSSNLLYPNCACLVICPS